MFSSSIQGLNRNELESLSESLVIGISTHLQWLAKLNHALVCNTDHYEKLCHSETPHHDCQFGQWYYHINNSLLQNDDNFKNMGVYHKQMHKIACELVSNKENKLHVDETHYLKFISTQHHFFEILLKMSKNSSESLGDIDYLTGLPNRRAFYQIIEKENSRINRTSKGSSIAIADIDYFKKINDNYGHDAGDKVLVEVAQSFIASLREYDSVGRFGGEEFIFCLPDTEAGLAKKIMERTRKKIERSSFDIGLENPIKITCSIGICHFDKNFLPDHAISCADVSLYDAKNSGRNKVILHNPVSA